MPPAKKTVPAAKVSPIDTVFPPCDSKQSTATWTSELPGHDCIACTCTDYIDSDSVRQSIPPCCVESIDAWKRPSEIFHDAPIPIKGSQQSTAYRRGGQQTMMAKQQTVS